MRSPSERALAPVTKTLDIAVGIVFLVCIFLWGILVMSRPYHRQTHRPRGRNSRLLCLVATTLKSLEAKGVVDVILYRDLNGYFDRVYTIHFPTGEDRVVSFSERHTVLEFSHHHFSGLHAFPFTNFVASEVRFLLSLLRLIRIEEISVIRGQDPYVQGLNALLLSRMTGIPFLVSITSNYDLTRKSTGALAYRFLRFHRIEKTIERCVFRRANLVIAMSDDNRDFAIRNGAPQERTAVVASLALPSKLHFDEKSPSRTIKLDLGLQDRKIAIYVGRLSPEKYPDDVVKCARHVANRRNDVVFLLLGDGPMRDELEQLAESLGVSEHVRMLGFQPQSRVRDLMYAADVIVSPLTGAALIEAALSGTPIVAYDVEWHRELIRNNDTGLLVSYRDHSEMASAVLWVLDHPREAGILGRRAKEIAFRQFHPTKVLNDEIACFERVLSEA